MMGLKDNDEIEVVMQQIGGGLDDEETAAVDAPITLRVKDQGGEKMLNKCEKVSACESPPT